MIVESQPESSDLHSVVVYLGRFHIQMSFLGSIRHLHVLKGSGIENVLEVIYANNTVMYLTCCQAKLKAVSRAVRNHFIIDLPP